MVTDFSHAAVADEEDKGGLGLGAEGGGCSVVGCEGGIAANTDLELLELCWEWLAGLECGSVSATSASLFCEASSSGDGACN